MNIIRSIQNRIYEIRGERVMLDRDLAALYERETKALNLAVKRNIKRFPKDFMFQLSKEEFEALRFQIEAIEKSDNPLRLQIETSKGRGGTRYLPYAFTEQGVAMLSGILNSEKAIQMNIAIMRAFVEVRRILLNQGDFKEQLKEIKERLGEHDVQLNQIYDAMENLLDEKAAERKWDERQRIGFKKS
jgi:phage regulator Rha-like protein